MSATAWRSSTPVPCCAVPSTGTLTKMAFHKEPFFGLAIPAHVPGIPDEVLDPRQAWADKAAYDRMAEHLIARFEANFSVV